MASAGLIEELNCPICLEIYADPVMLKCGHIFCQICIGNVLDSQEESGVYSCPECRLQFQARPLLEKNRKLCNIVECFMSIHVEENMVHSSQKEPVYSEQEFSVQTVSPKDNTSEPNTALESAKCSIHDEILEYYCFDDAVCVCADCCFSGQHGGHQVELLKEASEIKRERMRSTLQVLTTNKAEAVKRVQSLRNHIKEAKEKASTETERVTALLKDMKRQLEHLEKKVLGDISFQEEQVVLLVSGQIQQLDIKVNKLCQKIIDLETTLKVTEPLAFLKEPESVKHTEEPTVDSIKALPKLDMGLVIEMLHTGLQNIMTKAREMFGLKEKTESKDAKSMDKSSSLYKGVEEMPVTLETCHIEKQGLQSYQKPSEKPDSISASEPEAPFLFFGNPYYTSSRVQQSSLRKIPEASLPSKESWHKK